MKKCSFLLLVLFPIALLGQDQIHKEVMAEMKRIGCDKALPMLQQKINSGKAQNLDYYKKAWCEFERGQSNAGLQSLRSSLALTTKAAPLYKSILFSRADAYIKAVKLDSAIMDYVQLIKLDPKNVNYLINLSYVYGENGQVSESIAALEKARSIDEQNHVIYMNLAYWCGEAEDYTNAIKYAEKGLTLTKDARFVGSFMNNLGFAQSKVISAEKGLQTIQASLESYPGNAYAYFNMGKIYTDMKQKDKACANFLKAKELGAVNLTANYLKLYCK